MLDDVLLPAGLAPADAGLIVIVNVFASALTSAFGIGGGVLLLTVMASVLPPLAIVPVHGLAQLGNNVDRAWMTRAHCDRPVLGAFALGAGLGALLIAPLVVALPVHALQLAIAGFVLYLVWGPKPPGAVLSRAGLAAVGAVTTAVSMFVGATGPLVAAFVNRLHDERRRTVATFSACMSVQHGCKALTFAGLGFAFADWLPLLSLIVVAGVFGNWLGLKLLNRLPEPLFRTGFKVLVTVLAARLIWQALR